MFDRTVEAIKQIRILSIENKSSWCSGNGITEMSLFVDHLMEMSRFLYSVEESKSARRLLNKKQVANLYEYLHDMLVSNIYYFSKEIDTSTDVYVDTPMVAIYLFVAQLTLFMASNWPCGNIECFYDRTQKEIEYCVADNLDIVDNVRIKDFSVEEWLASIDRVAYGPLTFCDDLVDYVYALELRLCNLLLFTYGSDIHNVATFRHVVNDKRGEYVFSSSGEFHAITAMLSMHQTLRGSLQVIRRYDVPPYADTDRLLVNQVIDVLRRRASTIYDPKCKNDFKNLYAEATTTIMEGYLHIKSKKGTESVVKHTEAIRQFRSPVDWMAISERTNPRTVKLQDFLTTEKGVDLVGFKVAFKLMLNLIFTQVIKMAWDNFYYLGTDIWGPGDVLDERIMQQSEDVPLFVESLSDACILTRGELFVFGKTPYDYVLAFIYWMEVVAHYHNYKVSVATYINGIISMMFGTRMASDQNAASSTSELSSLVDSIDVLDADGDPDTFRIQDPPDTPPESTLEPSHRVGYFTSLFESRLLSRKDREALEEGIPVVGENVNSIPAFPSLDYKGLPGNMKSGWHPQ